MHPIALAALMTAAMAPEALMADTGTEITGREAALYDAFLQSDTAAMEEIFADGFVYQHGSGQDFDEAGFLSLMSSGQVVVTRADAPELLIRDFGDTVVTSGEGRVEGRVDDDPFEGSLRFVNVWHVDDGVWLLHHRNSQFVD